MSLRTITRTKLSILSVITLLIVIEPGKVIAYEAGQPRGAIADSTVVIEDIFGRRLNDVGIVLVDWEGYIANPAIELFVVPPAGAPLPGSAVLHSNEPRLYFDLASSCDSIGPKKTLWFFHSYSKIPFYVSIFPDRDTIDENFPLFIDFTDADGAAYHSTVNVHVIDQDSKRAPSFKIAVDFSQDQTGFLNDTTHRAIILQAADDWAYFLEGPDFDSVGAGSESTWIWNSDGFNSGKTVSNAYSYKGFLLYVYGIHSSLLRSGGEPSANGGYQSSIGVNAPLRRSGGVEIDTAGNYNSLGWFLTTGDDDWWFASNLGNVKNDLYSIAHHEMAHALFFNPAYPLFGRAKSDGFLDDPLLAAYHGTDPKIDASDHFAGEIDNASQKGVFGNEYYGSVPARRWLITKLDLLCVQAIGYTIRRTSAFVPLAAMDSILTAAVDGTPYADSVRVKGGIPSYCWAVESGTLPEGLYLDSFTGVISGTPSAVGTFPFTVRIRDNDLGNPGIAVPLTLMVTGNTSVPQDSLTPSSPWLGQNYPNPFNSSTTIRFALPKSAFVRIRIFNVLGEEIERLVAGPERPGVHVVRWEPRNLASGVYIARFEAGDFVEAKKILYLR